MVRSKVWSSKVTPFVLDPDGSANDTAGNLSNVMVELEVSLDLFCGAGVGVEYTAFTNNNGAFTSKGLISVVSSALRDSAWGDGALEGALR